MTRLPPPEMPGWLERELDFQRFTVEIDGMSMHCMESGAGRPVLMVHGNPTWGFLYRKVAKALSGDDVRVLMPDLIGLGFSHKPRDATVHTLDNHARWLGALIDALGLRDYVLVVQDWGGAIGVLGASEAAAPWAGLVVLNTVLSEPKPNFRATAFHRFARVPVLSELAFRGLGFPQNFLGWAQGDSRSVSGVVGRAYRYPLRRRRDRAGPLALARIVPDSLEHPSIPALRRCREAVQAFGGPAGIVWGDRDPVLGSVRGWIEKLVPQAEVTRTEAGHFLQEEVPEEIAAAVRAVVSDLGTY